MPFGKKPNELQSKTDSTLPVMNTLRGTTAAKLIEEDAKIKEKESTASAPEKNEKAVTK